LDNNRNVAGGGLYRVEIIAQLFGVTVRRIQQLTQELELREQKMKADIALKESQGELHRLKTDIAAGKYIAVEEVTMDYERFFVTFKNFAMSLPARLTDEISGYIDPLEARRIEKELHQKIRNLLVAFVVAGGSKQDGGKK